MRVREPPGGMRAGGPATQELALSRAGALCKHSVRRAAQARERQIAQTQSRTRAPSSSTLAPLRFALDFAMRAAAVATILCQTLALALLLASLQSTDWARSPQPPAALALDGYARFRLGLSDLCATSDAPVGLASIPIW